MAAEISDTIVLFDGVSAPILYAWGQQTSVMVPYEVAGKTTTTVQLVYQGFQSDAVTYDVAPRSARDLHTGRRRHGRRRHFESGRRYGQLAANARSKRFRGRRLYDGWRHHRPGHRNWRDHPPPGTVLPWLAAQVTCSVGGIPATVQLCRSGAGLGRRSDSSQH